jgi:hypothetical protein
MLVEIYVKNIDVRKDLAITRTTHLTFQALGSSPHLSHPHRAPPFPIISELGHTLQRPSKSIYRSQIPTSHQPQTTSTTVKLLVERKHNLVMGWCIGSEYRLKADSTLAVIISAQDHHPRKRYVQG